MATFTAKDIRIAFPGEGESDDRPPVFLTGGGTITLPVKPADFEIGTVVVGPLSFARGAPLAEYTTDPGDRVRVYATGDPETVSVIATSGGSTMSGELPARDVTIHRDEAGAVTGIDLNFPVPTRHREGSWSSIAGEWTETPPSRLRSLLRRLSADLNPHGRILPEDWPRRVWDALQHGGGVLGGGVLSDEDCDELAALVEEARCWPLWRGGEHVMVDLDEWREIVEWRTEVR